ncbi:unnamed protein product [Urochloa humidicola]
MLIYKPSHGAGGGLAPARRCRGPSDALTCPTAFSWKSCRASRSGRRYVRTGALSRRWRSLWRDVPYPPSRIDIDDGDGDSDFSGGDTDHAVSEEPCEAATAGRTSRCRLHAPPQAAAAPPGEPGQALRRHHRRRAPGPGRLSPGRVQVLVRPDRFHLAPEPGHRRRRLQGRGAGPGPGPRGPPHRLPARPWRRAAGRLGTRHAVPRRSVPGAAGRRLRPS